MSVLLFVVYCCCVFVRMFAWSLPRLLFMFVVCVACVFSLVSVTVVVIGLLLFVVRRFSLFVCRWLLKLLLFVC